MKSEKLTSLALIIAAIVLLIVGAKSYNDYLRGKYEKEFGGGPNQAEGQLDPGAAERAAAVAELPPAKTRGTDTGPGSESRQLPPMPSLAAENTAPAAATPPKASEDPRIRQYKESLETMRRENELYRQQLEQDRAGTGAELGAIDPNGAGRSIPPPSPPPSDPGLPSSAVAAASGTSAPGDGPPMPLSTPPAPPKPEAVEQDVSEMAERIRREAAIAKVIEYDADWAFLVLDGGADRGIETEMRFAVRRGGEILGWVKITEVEQDRAVAHLMSENKNSKTTRKPERGDDIIAFNLF